MEEKARRHGPLRSVRAEVFSFIEENGPCTLHDLSAALDRPVDSLGVSVFKMVTDGELVTLGRAQNPGAKGGRPLNIFGLPGQSAPCTKLKWEEDQEAILASLALGPKTLDELMESTFPPDRSKQSIRIRLGLMVRDGLIFRSKTVHPEGRRSQLVSFYGLSLEQLEEVRELYPILQRRIMDRLASRGPTTAIKLAEALDEPTPSVRRTLKELERKGKVFQVDLERHGRGSPRIVYWIESTWPKVR